MNVGKVMLLLLPCCHVVGVVVVALRGLHCLMGCGSHMARSTVKKKGPEVANEEMWVHVYGVCSL